jgi:hypothetical protein
MARAAGERSDPVRRCFKTSLALVSCSDGMDSSRNVLGIEVPTLP